MTSLITLPNEHFAVIVPEGTIKASIDDITNHLRPLVGSKSAGYMCPSLRLPPGSYTIVALGSDISEEQAALIVGRFNSSWGTSYYPEYPLEKKQGSRRSKPGYDKAIPSFHSLLAANNLSASTVVIIKQNK